MNSRRKSHAGKFDEDKRVRRAVGDRRHIATTVASEKSLVRIARVVLGADCNSDVFSRSKFRLFGASVAGAVFLRNERRDGGFWRGRTTEYLDVCRTSRLRYANVLL